MLSSAAVCNYCGLLGFIEEEDAIPATHPGEKERGVCIFCRLVERANALARSADAMKNAATEARNIVRETARKIKRGG
jgi:hypothetical protein